MTYFSHFCALIIKLKLKIPVSALYTGAEQIEIVVNLILVFTDSLMDNSIVFMVLNVCFFIHILFFTSVLYPQSSLCPN